MREFYHEGPRHIVSFGRDPMRGGHSFSFGWGRLTNADMGVVPYTHYYVLRDTTLMKIAFTFGLCIGLLFGFLVSR